MNASAESRDLVFLEINEAGLSKKALSILRRCDPLIAHYNNRPDSPHSIALFRDDFRLLAEQLEKTKQDINRRTYRGSRLLRYE